MAMDMSQFGAIVRARRAALGRSQEWLAAEALNNADRKGYISQIENGKLPNITALTLTKIARALEIPQAEVDGLLGVTAPGKAEVEADIDALRHEKGSLEAALADLRSLTRAQLIALAAQFEVARPWEASDAALVEELGKKAEDWRALRAQVDAIPEGLRQLSNLKGAAQEAFAAGRFDEVEDLLERVHQVEIEEAARTAELRAETALLRGRVDQAHALLAAAADSFAGIDPLEPARRRILRYFRVLSDHGLRYGGPGLRRGLDLLAPVLTDDLRGRDAPLWAAAKNAEAIVLTDIANRTGGAEGAGLLGQAVAAYAAALEVWTRSDYPVDWAATQNNLGQSLQAQGKRTGGAKGAKLLSQAVAFYHEALEVYTNADHPEDWVGIKNNIGNTLSVQGERTGGKQGAALLGQAVKAYHEALKFSKRAAYSAGWAMTQNNLGAALWAQGIRTGGAEGAGQLMQAVAAHRVALEVYTRANHPVDWAMTQMNLGIALAAQGKRTGGAEGAGLLGQAVAAYTAALEVRTCADDPVGWAMTQENLAMVHLAMADHDTCTDPAPHLRAALEQVEAALEVYDPEHMPYDHGTATALRDRLRQRLGL